MIVQNTAESVKPYDEERAKGEQVKEMFDNIAPAYDFMNRLMTLGIDKYWRRTAIKMLSKHFAARQIKSPHILDVATGTGDLAIYIANTIAGSKVTGIDLSPQMTAIGREKVHKAGLDERVSIGVGDSLSLDFEDNTFDAVSVAFGVRNFEQLADGYREMYRVLRPGGMLCVIELSVPTNAIILPFYRLYTRHLIPLAGRLASKDMSAYTYLPASIEAVAQGEDMTSLIESCGYGNAAFRCMTFGVCTIYTALKQ